MADQPYNNSPDHTTQHQSPISTSELEGILGSVMFQQMMRSDDREGRVIYTIPRRRTLHTQGHAPDSDQGCM